MSRVSSDLFSPLPEPAGDMFGPAGASRRLLGIVALIAAVVVVVAATVIAFLGGYPIGVAGGRALAEAPVGQGIDPTWIAPLQGWVLVVEITFWIGTLGGLWALIQGLIAIATHRGREFGIAAAVVAFTGPALFIAAGTSTLLAGFATASTLPVG